MYAVYEKLKKEPFGKHACYNYSLMVRRFKQLKKTQTKKKKKVKKSKLFNGINQLSDYFNTEEKCLTYLEGIRWKENGRYCPLCGSFDTTPRKESFTYDCHFCKEKFTVKSNSMFEAGRTPMRHWLTGIYLENCITGGLTGGEAENLFPECRRISTEQLLEIRRFAFNQSCFPNHVPIEGETQSIYAMDATIFDGKDSGRPDYKKRGHYGGRHKFVVLTIAQIGGYAKTYIVNDETIEDIIHIVQKHIPKGSMIYTDGHATYKALPDYGYDHIGLDHSKKLFACGDVSTNLPEAIHSILKVSLKKFRSLNPLYGDIYLAGVLFKYNTPEMNQEQKLEKAITNAFTYFIDQPKKIEGFKEKLIALRDHRDDLVKEAKEQADLKKTDKQKNKDKERKEKRAKDKQEYNKKYVAAFIKSETAKAAAAQAVETENKLNELTVMQPVKEVTNSTTKQATPATKLLKPSLKPFSKMRADKAKPATSKQSRRKATIKPNNSKATKKIAPTVKVCKPRLKPFSKGKAKPATSKQSRRKATIKPNNSKATKKVAPTVKVCKPRLKPFSKGKAKPATSKQSRRKAALTR